MDLQIGSTVGDYQVIGVLGAGGMGSVYQVRNIISDRVEALKILLPDLAGNSDLAERFVREIKVLGSLEHPNIAQLHTAFHFGNQLFMVMEFVDGVTLDRKLREGPLPVAQALDAISQVLSALELAHSQGVIHRDIKPANMIMTAEGVVKLMDFGIAKAAADHQLTGTGDTLGSLYYMAPEQIQGVANLDGRADLYSVGVTLYQLVTGRRPFDGDSQYAIMAAHLEKMPVAPIEIDPNLPRMLNDVILMSVAKDPNDRFQSAEAFRNALGAVAAAIQAPVRPVFAPRSATFTPVSTPPPAPFATTVPLTPPQTPPQPVPQAAPQAAPAMAPPMAPPPPMRAPVMAAQPKSRRGLWMALGGIAAVAAIVCVIEFVPWKGAKADSTSSQTATAQPAQPAQQPPPAEPAPSTPPQDAALPTPAPAATPAPSAAPASASALQPLASSRPVRPAPGVAGASPTVPGARQQETEYSAMQPVAAPPRPVEQQPQTPPAAPAPSGPSREEVMKAREHMAKLQVRADSVRQSLGSLRRAQQARGMGLNARFTQPEALMNTYLQSAAEALNSVDLPAAREYADKAERQIEILEKLLNL